MRLYFLVLLLPVFFCCPAFPQSPDWDQRVAFADNVHKIKYWAFIEGDSTYNCYADAVKGIQDMLNKKGYDNQRVFYFPNGSLSLESWKAKQIKDLNSDEAFLEIRVGIRVDTSGLGERGSPTTLMVQDASGRVYAQHSLRPEEVRGVDYTSISQANLYLKMENTHLTTAIPFYSKKATVTSPDIGSAARNSLRGIPASRHPGARKKPAYLNKDGFTMFEFAAYGGYCSGGTIDVTGGKATFDPGPDYGLEFMVNVYKGLDVSIGYKREDTFTKVDAPRYSKEGDLALSNNYILISCLYRFFHKNNLQPYVGFDFGSVNLVMKDKLYRDVWYFAVGGRAGLNWYVTRVLGFRFQTQLLYQVHPTDAPFIYSDEISEMSHTLNAESTLPQFDVTLGILIRLGK